MKIRWTVLASVALLTTAEAAHAGSVTTETLQGRTVRVFTPSTPAAKTPLVVMLHGCTQAADAFAAATRMEATAEAEGFVVAFPEQPSSVGSNRCFQWYDSAHQKRGSGEPKELADTIDALVAGHGIDADRVYVAGLSAGAGMSVVLGATYPDKVTAIGVVAGLEYGAASTISGVLSASGSGGPDPDAQGDLAFAQMGAAARVVPTFVIHGTVDAIVAKVNGDQVAAQWRRTNERVLGDGTIDAPVTTQGNTGYPFTRTLHLTKAEKATIVEHLVVDGLGHAWPGGLAGGSFSDPKGPDASKVLWAFFAPRTKAAPLVAPPVIPPPGTEPDPEPTPLPDDDNPNGSPSSSTSSSDDGGGCSVVLVRDRHAGLPGALLLGLGALVLARRRRS